MTEPCTALAGPFCAGEITLSTRRCVLFSDSVIDFCVTSSQVTYGLRVLLLNSVAKISLGASSGVQYFSI